VPFTSPELREHVGRKKLGLIPLVMTIFFCVSGGPHGLEPIVQSGHGMAILLILVVPFIWAIPIALMSAELGSMMPEEGGYYEWVKHGIGKKSAFFCAWFTYLYSCVDVAIYPVLFISYLKVIGLEHALASPLANFGVAIVMIAPLTWLNIKGAVTTGNAATLFAVVLLAPFVYIVFVGIVPAVADLGAVAAPLAPAGMSAHSAFEMGLFVIMWNYLGWDSISTISGEVKDAKHTFPRALMMTIPLVILSYLLPVLVGIHAVPDISQWTDGSWPTIARAIGGDTLAYIVAAVGLLSAAGLFVSGLLAASRLPFVLAEDGYFPRGFIALHKKYRTPARAIVVSAAIYLVLSQLSFEMLAEVDVLLYSVALLFEFAALIRLRQRQPSADRPFRIKGGMPAVVVISLLPALLIVVAGAQMFRDDPIVSFGLLCGALIAGSAILLFQRKRGIPSLS
jgi:amino acid transporter